MNTVISNKDEVKYFKSRLFRILLVIIGTISLFLGVIGIFIPLLPTTPFLLLSAACYARSSKKFYQWLLSNKYFGEYIKNYREKKGVPIKIKIYSITLLWITILTSVFLFVEILILKILLVAIAFLVSIHIMSLKTLNKKL